MNQQLYARKGIAFLAHLAKVPLLTVASYRRNGETICLKFYEPIFPKVEQARDVFAANTTQFIYKQVEPIVKHYPEQWEAWLYIHKTAKIIHVPKYEKEVYMQESNNKKIYFDSARFGIFKVQAKPFLLRKHTYTFHEISTQLHDVLSKCVEFPIEAEYFDSEHVRQLQMEGVLRYV